MGDRIDYEEMRRLRDAGLSNREIAQQLECSESSVQKVARRLGFPKRSEGRAKPIDVPLLFRLWAEGVGTDEIAVQLGVSISTLWLLRKRHALPPRTPRERAARAMNDPTPEEIADRARECHERHYAERRGESGEASRIKTWRHGGAA